MNQKQTPSFATRAVRAGQIRTFEGEHNDPIFMTSSFVFASAAEAALRFTDKQPGNVYSRFTNPTVRTFEQRLATLEDAAFCQATASGMAAVLVSCMVMVKAGDHIVASQSLFGSTVNVFTKILARFGVTTTFVAPDQLNDWEAAITPATKLLFVESPSNPLGQVVDIRKLADIAHAHDCHLVVDNVACTPALQQPLRLGADVVLHSATKYLDGQGRAIGGAIATNDETLARGMHGFVRTAGPSLSPFNAWLFLKGLETLELRMHAHCANALTLAQWLENHPSVARVYYPGLPSNPGHAIACQQQSGFGGVVAFDVVGDQSDAWQVVDATTLLSITANLGDAKSTITHPATTTHARLEAHERERMGVGESLIRVAVGLEDVGDIIADLDRGLTAVRSAALHKAKKVSSPSAPATDGYAGDVSPEDAWTLLMQDHTARLVDVRTQAEWDYVGLPDLDDSPNTLIRQSWKLYPEMAIDEKFVEKLQQSTTVTEATTPLLFLCRSGVRSREAAIAMTEAGYTRCYNILEGFEGDKNASQRRGSANGWKAAGLPWTQG